MRGHTTYGKARLAATVLGLAAVASFAGCAIGFRGPAPDVSDSTAFIQGDVLSNRTEAGEAWFKYGTTSAYGEETEHGTVAFEAGVRQGYFGLLSGLDHHTTYHYSLCADDQEPGVGAFCSGDQTFTTRGDHVRGSLQALVNNQVVRVTFNDVETGYHGEDPRGTVFVSAPAGDNPVTCLRITGVSRFTVGVQLAGSADHSFFFVNLPSSGSGTAGGEDVGARPPTDCPADPLLGTTLYPAVGDEGFEVVDEG